MIHIFVINSAAGMGSSSNDIREHLAKRTDIEYYIFHTRQGVFEAELVRQIRYLFPEDKLRIYACGGSGTMRGVINGTDDFSNIEFAFYPRGMTNDFLKVFKDQAELFEDLDNLIEGKVVHIDYMKTNHGKCLNTVSLGLDSKAVQKIMDYSAFSLFGSAVPYAFGFISAIIGNKSDEYEVTIDDKHMEGRFSEIFFGNGGILGGSLAFDNDANVRDGVGTMVIAPKIGRLKLINAMKTLTKGDQAASMEYLGMYTGRKLTVRRLDEKPIAINQDGEIVEAEGEWTIEIVKKGLPFVVPKEVTL